MITFQQFEDWCKQQTPRVFRLQTGSKHYKLNIREFDFTVDGKAIISGTFYVKLETLYCTFVGDQSSHLTRNGLPVGEVKEILDLSAIEYHRIHTSEEIPVLDS